jgi:hypothetical protein
MMPAVKQIVARKILSIVLLLVAVASGGHIVRRVMDGAGPPAGALCVSLPIITLLVAAGAAWPASPNKPAPTWFYAMVVAAIAMTLLYLKITYAPD